MPLTPHETFLFELRYWYPHMMPRDVEIWERFIRKWPDAYDHVQYDVHVGAGPAFDTTVNDETGAKDIGLYKKKIDVLAFKGEHIDIIELKPRASAAAVGQIKLYKRLFKTDYSPPVEPRCIIITDEMMPDLQDFARDEGVLVTVV